MEFLTAHKALHPLLSEGRKIGERGSRNLFGLTSSVASLPAKWQSPPCGLWSFDNLTINQGIGEQQRGGALTFRVEALQELVHQSYPNVRHSTHAVSHLDKSEERPVVECN